MNDAYIFKKVDKHDYKDIVIKCSFIFDIDYDSLKEVWDWLFKNNPLEKKRTSTNNRIIIEKDNEIIGHITCFPQQFIVKNQPTIFYFVSFFFIDSTVNNPTLAIRLAKSFLKINKDRVMISNSPSDATIQIFSRYGSFCVKDFSRDSHFWIIKIDNVIKDWILYKKPNMKWMNFIFNIFRPLFRLVNSFINNIILKKTKNCEFVKCDKADSEFLLFFNKMIDHYNILAYRDEIYLEWRYFKHPSKNIYLYKMIDSTGAMLGYLSFNVRIRKKSGVKYLDILDIFCDHNDKSIVFSALNKIIEEGKIHDVDLIKISFLTKEINNLIKIFGFVTIKNQGNNIIIFNNNSHVDDSFLQDKNNWYMCSADGDAILGVN